MTQFNKIQAQLLLWFSEELSEAEALEVERRVGAEAPWQQAYRELLAQMEALTEVPDEAPDNLLFRRQEKAIQKALDREIQEAQRSAHILGEIADGGSYSDLEDQEAALMGELVAKLKSLPQPAAPEEFFAQQLVSIQEKVHQEQEEAQLSAWLTGDLSPEESEALRLKVSASKSLQKEAEFGRQILNELQALSLEDPGELFFRRQRRDIHSKLGVDELPALKARSPWQAWLRPVAVAAALFFLVLGVTRIHDRQQSITPLDWQMALLELAEEEPNEEWVDWDDLSGEQLDLLANNMEATLIYENDDTWYEEPSDWDDLEDEEMDFLILGLENRAQT